MEYFDLNIYEKRFGITFPDMIVSKEDRYRVRLFAYMGLGYMFNTFQVLSMDRSSVFCNCFWPRLINNKNEKQCNTD